METKTKIAGASHAISKMCAGEATKNVFVDCAAEPAGAHWDGEIANNGT